MTRKTPKKVGIPVPLAPYVDERAVSLEPENVRSMSREIRRLERMLLRQGAGGPASIRDFLVNRMEEEHWEVPG